MKLKIAFILFQVFTSILVYGQDIHFSQYTQTSQLLNPAATGVFNGAQRATINYRNQWGVLGTSYKTTAASFDMSLFKSFTSAYLGIGGYFYKDAAGTANFGNFIGSLSVSGILPIEKKHTLSVGIQTGVSQYSAELNKLTWGNQFTTNTFDTNINSGEQNAFSSKLTPEIGAGIFYTFNSSTSTFLLEEAEKLQIGFSAFHLNQPKYDFIGSGKQKLPMKYIGQVRFEKTIHNTIFSIIPFSYIMLQGVHNEFNFGGLFKANFGKHQKYTGFTKESELYLGAHYRYKDAIVPQILFAFTDYMIGFSYDINTSSLSKTTRGLGGFEISLKYVNKPKAIMRSMVK